MRDSALGHCRCKGLFLLRGVGLGLLLLVFWLAASWSTAQAATLCVDKTNSPPCYATIQAAVNAASAGDTINIAAGTYQDGQITVPSGKSLSLVGSGAGTTILDGGGTSRVFLLLSPTSLSELTVQNGNAGANGAGGAIRGGGPITLTNVDVLSNTAGLTGGAISVDADLFLDHTVFRNNSSNWWVGGAHANKIVVTNSLFQENHSTGQYGKGGGVWAGTNLIITSTQFLSNTTVAGGGGAGGDSAVTVADSLFQGNSCSDINCKGGGVDTVSGTITGTQFINNTALAAGGGVNATGVLNIVNSKFSANVCTGNTCIGGALSLPSGTIYGSQIVSNTAGYYGGGLFASNSVVITSSQFVENSCSKQGCTGGGLYTTGGTITGTEILSNTSDANGAGAVFINVGTIINSRFGANRCTYSACYGGGLYLQSGGTIAGSQFISNTSPYQGGGVYAQQWTTVTDSRFERNVTTGNLGQAGALSLYQAGGSIARSEFISNTAQNKGGGLFSDGPVSITDSLFQQNRTNTGSGGGAYSTGGTITGTLFISNTAGTGFGGGLANVGSPVSPSSQYITATQFVANTAAYGGALYDSFTTGQIVNGLMVRNTAGNGMAYYQEGSNSEVLLLNTTIATPGNAIGSAILEYDGSLHITNTLVASYTIGIEQLGGTVTQDYNLFANVTTPTRGTVNGGTHSLTTDRSWFVDPENDNYRLLPGSPAFAKGIGAGLLVDLDGTARPNPPSIGAYEGTKAPPSMEFSKGVSASTEVPWQGTVTYTIVLTNTGPDPETNVIMTDVLPANVSFGHWVTQPANTVSDSGGITWTGTLASGDAITWTLVVTNTGSGGSAITNTARYSSTTLVGSAAATFSSVSTKCYPIISGDWSTAFGSCPAGTKRIIPAGVTVTLDGDITLEGDFEIEPGATFNANGKTVTLAGSAAQTLTGSPLPFSKLVINKTNKTDKVQIVGKLAVSKKLTIAKGTLVSASEYGDLEIEGQGVITLTNPISITGSFTNSGEFYTQGHAVNFTGGLVQPTEQNFVLNVATPFDDLNVMTGTTLVEAVTGDNATIAGTLANFGIIRKTQAIAGTGAYHFGLAGSKDAGRFQVDVTAVGSLTLLQADRVDAGPANALGVTPIYWHFTPIGTGYNVTLTLPQNGLTSPGACRRVSGSTWNCARSAYSATTITRAGVTEFSDWAVFEMQPLTAVLAAEPVTSVYGQTVTFTTTVTSPGAGGSVQFYADGTALGTIQQISAGTATVTSSDLVIGSHAITATILIDTGPYLDGEVALNGGVVVQPQPVAVNDAAGTLQDTPVSISVLANDLDPAGGGLTVSSVNLQPAHGAVQVTADNQTVIYTPGSGFAGQDSFVYVLHDANGRSDDALVTIVVSAKSQTGQPTQVTPVDPRVDNDKPFTSTHASVEGQLPAGFFPEPLGDKDILFLSYTPIVTPTEQTGTPPGNLKFGNFEFDLTLFLNNEPQHGIEFVTPITVTISYDPLLLNGVQENTLVVYYWDGTAWVTSGITIVARDPVNHTIKFSISHLSHLAFFAQAPTGLAPIDEPALTPQLYLPEIDN